MTIQIETQHVVDRNIDNLAILFELDVNGIQVQDGIKRCQRLILPSFYQRPDFIRDGLTVSGETTIP
jgi:hypothetical protein